QPWQCQSSAHRSSSDCAQQVTIEVRPAGDLASRDQWKQCPIGARKHEERHSPDQCRSQVPIIPGMPKPDTNGTAEPLDRQVLRPALRGTPPKQCPDNSEIAEGIDPEGCPNPDP